MNKINNLELSTKNIINIYLDLKGLQPNLNEWDEAYLSDNPPRYYRFRQLKILFDLYSLGDFQDFENGKFIKNRKLEEFNIMIEKANQFMNEYNSEYYEWFRVKVEDLSSEAMIHLFENLFLYRIKLDKVFDHNSGVIECSGLYRYTYLLTRQFNSYIEKELYRIDDVLSLIIDPSGKTFLANELATKYGYPDVDIKQIDREWI